VHTTRVRALAIAAVCIAAMAAVLVWRTTSEATTTPEPQVDPIVDVSVAAPVRMASDGPSELQIVKLTLPPGTGTGWHSHDASVLVAVEQGTATFYDADDPRCTPHRFEAGTGTPEMPGHVHITRNEGDTPLVLDVVFVVPPGGTPGIQQPRPGNCSF
jgi:quercetin dioxygenase-like cupin family protein